MYGPGPLASVLMQDLGHIYIFWLKNIWIENFLLKIYLFNKNLKTTI